MNKACAKKDKTKSTIEQTNKATMYKWKPNWITKIIKHWQIANREHLIEKKNNIERCNKNQTRNDNWNDKEDIEHIQLSTLNKLKRMNREKGWTMTNWKEQKEWTTTNEQRKTIMNREQTNEQRNTDRTKENGEGNRYRTMTQDWTKKQRLNKGGNKQRNKHLWANTILLLNFQTRYWNRQTMIQETKTYCYFQNTWDLKNLCPDRNI